MKKLYELTLFMSIAIMALGTVICLLASGQLIGLFTSNPDTIAAGAKALRIICIGFVVSAVSTTSSGALEGLGKGRAVAGDLAVPLCGVHHAAGRSAVRPPWPGRCVARLLDHRGAHRTGGLPGVPPRGGPALNLSGPFCSRLPDPGGLLFCCIPVALRAHKMQGISFDSCAEIR